MSDNRLRLFGHLSAGSESIDGKISIKALRGYSAYEIAVQEGFEGTEEEWLASMVGPQGPQGPEGPQGPQGIQGARGIQGESGKPISSIEKTGTDGYIDTYTITYNDSSTSTFTVTNGKNAEVEVWEDSTPTDYRLVFTDDKGSVTTPNLIPEAESVADVRNQLNMNMIQIRGQKADKDGTYDDLTSGTSKQLLSENYALDQVPYLFRKSPDSDRAVESIVGGSLGWNQLVITQTRTDTNNGITYTYNPDGSVIVNGTATANSYSNIGSTLHGFNNHVMVMSGCPSGGSADTYRLRDGYVAGKYDIGNGFLWKKTNDNFVPQLVVDNGVTVSNLKFVPQAIDLTTMFGSTIADYIYSLETATAGAGVAKLKEWGFFTEDYYEYCEPTLKSVEGIVRKKTVGWNQWDEEWVNGYFTNTGEWVAYASNLSTKNAIPVLPNTTYYMKLPLGDAFPVYLRNDKAYNQITASDFISRSTDSIANQTFTTPSDCHFMHFNCTGTYGTTYNHDICINLSDPTRNGQYEPYESHSYRLDSTLTLRGVPKLDSNNNLYFDGDVYPSDGNGSRRYGLVDLGTLNWNRYKAYGFLTTALSGLIKKPSTNYGKANVIILGFTVVPSNATLTAGQIAVDVEGRVLVVNDDIESDAASFKTAMSGIYLLYELATPTTFTAQPYHNPQIVGDTEKFVTTGVVPVGHSTKYYQNLRKKIEGLPWNFATLIAPTEERFVATRNYYRNDLFIIGNILYKASANIANGGTITPDTNCRATTLAEVIANL